MTRLAKTLLAVILIELLVPSGLLSVDKKEVSIVVFTSDKLTSTIRTLHGAKKIISRHNEAVKFHLFTVNQSDSINEQIIKEVKRLKPTLILTVGTSATELAKTRFENTPIVFSAVMYPALSGFVESMRRPGKNLTGASLDIPLKIQFKTFRDIVPDLKRIGVLYSVNTAPLMAPAAEEARRMGMELVAIRVNESKELPAALDSLARSTDGIWSVADPELFNPQSTRYILLNTMRKGIPFMGFSRHVVESGALFALDFDYKAVGQQAGQIANRIIEGEDPGRIGVSLADVIWFHYNEKTAKHINVAIPGDMIAVAKEVYR